MYMYTVYRIGIVFHYVCGMRSPRCIISHHIIFQFLHANVPELYYTILYYTILNCVYIISKRRSRRYGVLYFMAGYAEPAWYNLILYYIILCCGIV